MGAKKRKKQQKVRGSRRQRPTSEVKKRVVPTVCEAGRIRWRVLLLTPKTPGPVASENAKKKTANSEGGQQTKADT